MNAMAAKRDELFILNKLKRIVESEKYDFTFYNNSMTKKVEKNLRFRVTIGA